ncbi:hypothetical protein ACGFIG_09280 [Micromonospora sp. NPDC049048]|uniref:hypothetical protein n=1 Tax=Micromonospora sp. NPDC049048 TaxID=3364263 RepID=UPI003722CB5B
MRWLRLLGAVLLFAALAGGVIWATVDDTPPPPIPGQHGDPGDPGSYPQPVVS